MTYALISSPLQIISAEEFRYRNNLKFINYIYIYNRLYSNKVSREYVLNTFRYYEITYKEIHTHYDIYNILVLLYLHIKIQAKSLILIGDHNNTFMQMITKHLKNDYVIVEEGSSTFGSQRKISSKTYTLFNLIIKQNNNNISSFNIINSKESYEHLQIANNSINELHFFGSKLTFRKLSVFEEMSYLKKVYSFISNRHKGDIIYFPHRMDSYKKKEKIQSLGFKISETRLPAELLYTRGSRPVAIYTTLTSVAFTFTKLGLKPTVLVDDKLEQSTGNEYSVLNVINLESVMKHSII